MKVCEMSRTDKSGKGRDLLGGTAFVTEGDSLLWRKIDDNETIRASFCRILDSLLLPVCQQRVIVT